MGKVEYEGGNALVFSNVEISPLLMEDERNRDLCQKVYWSLNAWYSLRFEKNASNLIKLRNTPQENINQLSSNPNCIGRLISIPSFCIWCSQCLLHYRYICTILKNIFPIEPPGGTHWHSSSLVVASSFWSQGPLIFYLNYDFIFDSRPQWYGLVGVRFHWNYICIFDGCWSLPKKSISTWIFSTFANTINHSSAYHLPLLVHYVHNPNNFCPKWFLNRLLIILILEEKPLVLFCFDCGEFLLLNHLLGM